MTKREILSTDTAPAAIGPYSQAVRAGGFLYTAGQIPLVPGTDRFAADDLAGQTRQVMANLGGILAAAGLGFGDVVKTTVFLTDLGRFAEFNAAYAESFAGLEPPARSTVEVSALPLGAQVEIELVARLDEGGRA